MALDPQIEIILGLAKKANLPEIWAITPDQGREQYLMRVNKLSSNESIFRAEDRSISGPGSHIPIRIYTPARDQDRRETSRADMVSRRRLRNRLPGNPRFRLPQCSPIRRIALSVAVDYRPSRPNPISCGGGDCESALKWVALHAVEFGGDPAWHRRRRRQCPARTWQP